jgi:hypothetical protein
MGLVRRALSWLVVLPLAVGGSQLAHAEAYRLVYADPHERAHVLDGSGHAYFSYAPAAFALALAVLLCGLAGWLAHARRGRSIALATWPFAAVPLLTFLVQEHVERGTLAGVLAEPTTLVGLLLQLPFALLAFAVARLLLRVVEALAVARVRRPRIRARTRSLRPATPMLPPLPRLAFGVAQRGPPRAR